MTRKTTQKGRPPIEETKICIQTYMPQWAVSALLDSCMGKGPLEPQMAKGRTISSLICYLITEGPLAEHAPITKES